MRFTRHIVVEWTRSTETPQIAPFPRGGGGQLPRFAAVGYRRRISSSERRVRAASPSRENKKILSVPRTARAVPTNTLCNNRNNNDRVPVCVLLCVIRARRHPASPGIASEFPPPFLYSHVFPSFRIRVVYTCGPRVNAQYCFVCLFFLYSHLHKTARCSRRTTARIQYTYNTGHNLVYTNARGSNVGRPPNRSNALFPPARPCANGKIVHISDRKNLRKTRRLRPEIRSIGSQNDVRGGFFFLLSNITYI